ncbi:MAG TPA: CDP-alcohol phosphatidyltransferase family protein [Candidatus Hypogeohydataceae bacterium YC41]
MTLANKVTLLRILLTPFLILCTLKAVDAEWCRYLAASILFLVGIGDIIDGYIAKKRNEVTVLGQFLDPAADKFVVISLCIILSSRFWPGPHLPFWLASLILCRELFIITGFLSMFLTNVQPSPWPCLLGRINNNAQQVMYGVVIVGNVMPNFVLTFFWWGTGFFSLISLLAYIWLGIDILSKRQRFNPSVRQRAQEVP